MSRRKREPDKIRPPPNLVRRFFNLVLDRQFAEAERTLSKIKKRLDGVEWGRGYIQALNGIILTQRSNSDRYSFLSNLDLDNVEMLERSNKEFIRHSEDALHTDYDRGFFSAWVDFTSLLLRKTGRRRTASD